MKKLNLLMASFAGVILITHTGIGHAANQVGSFTFTPSVSYLHFAGKRDLTNSTTPTLSLGYIFTSHWGAEASYSVISSEDKASNQHVHGRLYLLEGIYYFSSINNCQPYAIAGVGATSLNPSLNTENDTQTNINAGLGSEYFVNPKVALRGEVKDLYTLNGGKNDALANLGINFLIG